MGRRLKLDDQGHLEFYEGTGGGTSKITLQGPATLAGDYTLTLPLAQGGASTFLQNDGTGVLSWGTGTSTLQSAYTAGAKIDADGTVVEIEVAAAAGNTALLIDQDDDQKALDITKDGVGAGNAVSILNAGTGVGLDIDQNGAGIALNVDQDGAAIALRVDQSTANAGISVIQSGAAAAITLSAGAAAGFVATQANDNRVVSVTKTGVGAGEAVFIENDGTGTGLSIVQDGAGIAVDIDQDGAAIALRVDQSTANAGVSVIQSGAAAGLAVSQSTTSLAADILKTGASGNAVDIENDGTGICLLLDQDGNGIALDIDSEATGQPLIRLVPLAANTRGTVSITGTSTDPSGTSPGDIWYNSAEGHLRYLDQSTRTLNLGSHTYNTIADPGDGNTITPHPTCNFYCDFTNSTGSQTRVLADPAFIGQRGILTALFTGGGTDTTIDEPTGWLGGGAADNTATFNTSGEIMEVLAVSATEWRASSSFGVAFT